MNKKVLSLMLASSVLTTVPVAFNANTAQAADSYQVAVNMNELIDVPENHWAYGAVRVLVQELDIMMPKTSNMFKGNDLMTRNELAEVFHKATQKMEAVSGKNLKQISDVPRTNMIDLDDANRVAVDAVVNDYGIMQPMPGKRFMGNEPISRYEIAFELYNYFVLIESQGTKPVLARRSRADELTDLPADHWATKAVTNIVDKYQIMDGYPNATFQGGKRLTRYETAATVREFIRYVDTYLLPLTPAPTPVPTAVPTAMPTAKPTAKPTPTPEATKEPFNAVDIRIGGDFKTSYTDSTNTKTGYIYGPSGSFDWTPIQAGPISHFGIDLHGDMMYFDPIAALNPNAFKADRIDANGNPFQTTLGSRMTAGGGLLWKIQETAEDVAFTIGAGYDYMQILGSNYSYANHGPRGRMDLEIPIGPYFSLIGREAFTYFISPTAGVGDNMQWKNDAFVGINIPAYSTFAVELGYKDTRYMLAGNQGLFGDVGGQLNLRFRF